MAVERALSHISPISIEMFHYRISVKIFFLLISSEGTVKYMQDRATDFSVSHLSVCTICSVCIMCCLCVICTVVYNF